MLGGGRRQGLDDHLSPGLAAAAAPGELGDHREGALLGAEVGEAQRRVGVEDRAQRHLGEVVALGDHLGADQDRAARLVEAAEDAGVGAASGGGVGVEPEDRHRVEAAGQQRLDLLGADAGPRQSVVESQSGQDAGSGSAWAQWWQTRRPLWRWTISETSQLGQLQCRPQERQVSQGAKPRRLTITIALAPARRTALQRLPGGGVQRPRARIGLAHVDHLDRRHPAAVDPARQLQPRQLQPRLRARRRGAGDQHGPALLGAPASDGAGVVGGVPLLLVGGIVLLVDHDQPEVLGPGRRSPSAGRRRRSPRRRAGAATRRSAGRPVRAECRTAKRSPSRARKRATACGARPISGTRTIAPFPGPAPPRRRRGRPRSCPSR